MTADGAGQTVVVTKEMGITHAEFHRLLPNLLKSDRHTVGEDGRVEVTLDHGATLTITLGPEVRRIIVSLDLPTTTVNFHFSNFGEREREIFLKLFDDTYRRGGG